MTVARHRATAQRGVAFNMKTILIVDDNKLNLATARTVLMSQYKVIPVMRGQQALTYLEKGECDIILLDINMPDMDGFEVMERIRKMEHCRFTPVIFLTGDGDAETETRCLNAGAVDFIRKPFVPEVMLSRISRALVLEEVHRRLEDKLAQSTREVTAIRSKFQQDVLTGLWNRDYTEEAVGELLAGGTQGALMMVDIDNFKSVNDNYGHATGDSVLKILADTLRGGFREGDVLCRLGGDEFMIFVKDASSKGEVRKRATELITGFCNAIDHFGFEVDTSVSIGIACAPEDGTDFKTLYSCADKALYYVKRNGKNSSHFYSDKLKDENAPGQGTVNLKYLQELMWRSDDSKGAYILDMESFQNVYNFIQRYIDRTNRDVSALLFTLRASGSPRSMELLEKMMFDSLRRSDIATRYSSRQLLAILMDSNAQNAVIAAERVINNFRKVCQDESVQLEYDITPIRGRSLFKNADEGKELSVDKPKDEPKEEPKKD